MKTIDPRIRTEHIERYGLLDEIEDYLRVLGSISPVSDDEPGENHHMLAKSIWPEYANLNVHRWNKIRASYAIHTALTELQARFEDRLKNAVLLRKGMSVEALFEAHSRGGKIGGKRGGKRCKELYPNHFREIGRKGGTKCVESGQFARIKDLGNSKGGLRSQELHPYFAICQRWNINRNKPCTCGQHVGG